MRANPSAYISDRSKVNFVMSYLRNSALQHVEPYIMNEGSDVEWIEDYDLFVEELRTNFGMADPIGEAAEELDYLRMRNDQKIVQYNIDFNKHATRLSWDDNALYFRYYKGLADRIKDVLAQSSRPLTLKELRLSAQSIDSRYWQRKQEKNRSEQSRPKSDPKSDSQSTSRDNSSNPSGKNSSNNASTSNKNSKPKSDSKPANDLTNKIGKDGKLTAEERKRRFEFNLCLFCGAMGHRRDDCPKRKSSPKARKATTQPDGASPSSDNQSKN